MKKPKRKELLPIILCEGGIVQEVFLPKPDGDRPFTDVAYEIVDLDIFEDQNDEDITAKWESLEPETRGYIASHMPDVHRKFLEAFATVETERKERERCFVKHTPRSLESLKLADPVLRRTPTDNRITAKIDALTLIGAISEMVCFLADNGEQASPRELALEFAKGEVVKCGVHEYVLDDRTGDRRKL